MSVAIPTRRVFRFGPFEVNAVTRELRKKGTTLKLRPQAAKVLVFLLAHAGELVTREQLKQEIWGEGFFVDFEHGLNICIRQIRAVLDDDAERPRYIETVPRQGYRFIARLEEAVDEKGVAAQAYAPQPNVSVPDTARAVETELARPTRTWRWSWVAVTALLSVCTVVAVVIVVLPRLRDRFRTAAHPIRIESLAVLPLENLSRDPEQEYFADGMTDELITELAKVHALRVISRNSIMQFKGKHKPIPEVARDLKVDAVVEGTVMRSGDQVRITAQLIEAPTDRHLWAEEYEGNLQNVLALQDEVARAITRQIQAKLTPEEQTRLASAKPVNLEAHEAYLKGRYYLNKRTENGFREAIEFFTDAVQRDNDYALGYAGLADTYVLLGEYNLLPGKEAFTKAREGATKALELDNTLAEAHNALAATREDYDWDWQGAEREFRRATELNPGYATAHQWYAELLSELGRDPEALAEIKQAQQLDPFSLIINTVSADVLRTAGLNDSAIEQLRNTLEIDPNFAHAHFHLGLTLLRKDAFPQAVAEFQMAVAISPSVIDYKGGLGYAYARAGNEVEARKMLQELNAQSRRGRSSCFYIAAIYAGMGEKDQAFAFLEKAIQEREQGLAVIRREPLFDPLQSDPRYRQLLRRINLPLDSRDAISSHY